MANLSYNISSNATQVREQFRQLRTVALNRAEYRAINFTAQKVFTATKKEGAKQLQLPQWVLGKRMRMRKANGGKLFATITYDLKGIPLIALAGRQSDSGVATGQLLRRVKQEKHGVRVGRRFFKGMFLAQMSNNHFGIFIRHETARKRRSRDVRRVKAVNQFTGRINKTAGRKYRAALPIAEPTKRLSFLRGIIISNARTIVSREFKNEFYRLLRYEVSKLTAR